VSSPIDESDIGKKGNRPHLAGCFISFARLCFISVLTSFFHRLLAIKAVKQRYSISPEIGFLSENFRRMVNDCLSIGLREGVTSLKSLSLLSYHQLNRYKVPTYYRLSAISRATGMLKNYRKAVRENPKTKHPYARKLVLCTSYGFKVASGNLLVPYQKRKFLYVPLNKHTQDVINAPGIRVRSVFFSSNSVSVAYSRDVPLVPGRGILAIDRNLENVTTVSSLGNVSRFDLSVANTIRIAYRGVKSHFTRNDRRIRKTIFRKYGDKSRNRVHQRLHLISKELVNAAKRDQCAIAFEKLCRIRSLYRAGNGLGRDYRGKMNSWTYGEFQRQVEYKARWEGVSVYYVDARGTSVNCSICGSRTYPNERRTLYCPACRTIVDRDVNAAKNIMKRGMRFVPIALPSEVMRQESSEAREVILRVDGSEVSQKETLEP